MSNARITILSGVNSDSAEVLITRSEALIGRAPDCDVLLEHPTVSGRHARVYQMGDAYFLEDLQSTNGSAVNGAAISGPTPLKPGDLVQVGEVHLLFQQDIPAGGSTMVYGDAGGSTMVYSDEGSATMVDTPSVSDDAPPAEGWPANDSWSSSNWQSQSQGDSVSASSDSNWQSGSSDSSWQGNNQDANWQATGDASPSWPGNEEEVPAASESWASSGASSDWSSSSWNAAPALDEQPAATPDLLKKPADAEPVYSAPEEPAVHVEDTSWAADAGGNAPIDLDAPVGQGSSVDSLRAQLASLAEQTRAALATVDGLSGYVDPVQQALTSSEQSRDASNAKINGLHSQLDHAIGESEASASTLRASESLTTLESLASSPNDLALLVQVSRDAARYVSLIKLHRELLDRVRAILDSSR